MKDNTSDSPAHLRERIARLEKALGRLLALHADSVFICGVDDQTKVDSALRQGERALRGIAD